MDVKKSRNSNVIAWKYTLMPDKQQSAQMSLERVINTHFTFIQNKHSLIPDTSEDIFYFFAFF
jgi:hypothetical protein